MLHRLVVALALLNATAVGPVAAQSGVEVRDLGVNRLVITANPYVGAPVSPYDSRVSPFSSDGALNRFTTGGGRIYGADGTYLGRLNSNRYDPESVANPYGLYGSR